MGQIKNSYDPNRRPTTPSALDDEFDDGALNAKWTVFQSTGLTTTEGDHLLKLSSATHAGDRYQGYFQTLPAGDFTIVTKVGLETARVNYSYIGLALFEDAVNNPNTCNLITTLVTYGSTLQYMQIVRYTQYDTWSATPIFVADTAIFISSYIRIRRNGTTLYYDFSTDGVTFLRIGTDAQWFNPAQVGVVINNGNTGLTINGYFDFFRYKASDDVGLIGSW